MSTNTAISKLPPMTPTMRAGIIGISGSGKGNCAKAYLAREQRRIPRIVVFDAHDEYSTLGKERPGFIHLGTMTARATAADFLSDPGRFLDRKKVALSVVPSANQDVAAEQCATFCELLMSTGDFLVVFDEMGGYAFNAKRAHLAETAIDTLACEGRKEGLSCLFVSQRLMHFSKSAREQVNALEIFCQQDPDDLRQLVKRTGNKSLIDTVPQQGPGVSTLWVSPMLKAA